MRHALLSLLVIGGITAMSGCHNPVSDAINGIEHKVFYRPEALAKEINSTDGADRVRPGIAIPRAAE